MINEDIRAQLYQEIEREFPLRRTEGAGATAKPLAADATTPDLRARCHEKLVHLKERLLSQVLFHLHTLFDFSVEEEEVSKSVRNAIEKTYSFERQCGTSGDYDATSYAVYLFRKFWHRAGSEKIKESTELLTGLHHVELASFFQKAPQEIAAWTRRFLQIERYHRLDASEHEKRMDRYRLLRSQFRNPWTKPSLHFDDLLIWLEFRLLEESSGKEVDLGLLSREIAAELEGAVSPELFDNAPLQPIVYVLLKCHQYCLAETLEPKEQSRLEHLYATRQLDSLLDLMRVVINRTITEQRIPDSSVLLDRLQWEGFNIEHQGFRDPYESQLVALNDIERLENASLPLFLPLEQLSGEFQEDLSWSRHMLNDWHRQIFRQITSDCETYAEAVDQALPKTHLLEKLIRFATSWTLAQFSWFPARFPEDINEQIRSLLPDSLIRQLVRPRKGYEIKSRQELNRLIEQEKHRQVESLERIAQGSRIRGYHDYTQFIRYLVFQRLRELQSDDPAGAVHHMDDLLQNILQPEWVVETSKKWGLDSRQAHPHTLQAVKEYAAEVANHDAVLEELQKRFESSENELDSIYRSVIVQFSPEFYRLLVGYGRSRLELSRLPANLSSVERLVALLVPSYETIHRLAAESVREEFSTSGLSEYRYQFRPYLIGSAEWKAYLAWQTFIRIGDDVEKVLEEGSLDNLLEDLEKAAQRIDLPPHSLLHETVQTTLLELIKPDEKGNGLSETQIREVSRLLPQMDCAACGEPNCRQFARALLLGSSEPAHCVQLPKSSLPLLMEKVGTLREQVDTGSNSVSLLKILSDRQAWRNSKEKEIFRNVLSVTKQKARRLFLERVREIWENSPSKPQVFKMPPLEELHQELGRYMGFETVDLLREEERDLLIEYGEQRFQSEWQALKANQNWLTLVDQRRQSRPLLKSHDPEHMAANAYRNVFFLHQLSPHDRQLVIRHRYETHHDNFSHWWNEDLLTMNHPEFSIRDWEDFSKIIKNAYWHQESSLPAGELLANLKQELLSEDIYAVLQKEILKNWIGSERAIYEQRRQKLSEFRQKRRELKIEDISDLRNLILALIEESKSSQHTEISKELLPSNVLSMEDRLNVEKDAIWQRFQQEGFAFSLDFSCHVQQLTSTEKLCLEAEPGIDDSSTISDHSSRPESHYILSNWKEPLGKRVAFLQAIILSKIKELQLEEEKRNWLTNFIANSTGSEDSHFLPTSFLKFLIRERLREGKDQEEIEAELNNIFSNNQPFRNKVVEDTVFRFILKCQFEYLLRISKQDHRLAVPGLGKESSAAPPKPGNHGAKAQTSYLSDEEILRKSLPHLESYVNLLLERHKTVDRDRLLHYLFLLAKMEGNLDSLTALLREIRETSDIIEAAWLRFTEERILEGPIPKSLPGTSLGIPLLASRIKDKGPVNQALAHGISRKEKKNVASAVRELLNFIRFHVLVNMETGGNLEDLITSFNNAGYDLSGIDEQTLRSAIEREWKKREQLVDQKIWIYTTVTARRLAAQDPELQEAERDFYKIRNELLKQDGIIGTANQEIASRRGVALGRIKEEMYRQLSDLLETERIATFQNRIRQIVDQLDQKRLEIALGWYAGEINRRTLFYVLRQYQKTEDPPTWDEFQCFLRDHWFMPLMELRHSQRPDRLERIHELDDRFRAIFGVSLLECESEAEKRAEQELQSWIQEQTSGLETTLY